MELKLTKDAIEHIAELARLDLTENEKEELVFEMEKLFHILINWMRWTLHMLKLLNT